MAPQVMARPSHGPAVGPSALVSALAHVICAAAHDHCTPLTLPRAFFWFQGVTEVRAPTDPAQRADEMSKAAGLARGIADLAFLIPHARITDAKRGIPSPDLGSEAPAQCVVL